CRVGIILHEPGLDGVDDLNDAARLPFRRDPDFLSRPVKRKRRPIEESREPPHEPWDVCGIGDCNTNLHHQLLPARHGSPTGRLRSADAAPTRSAEGGLSAGSIALTPPVLVRADG